ncbi:MAG: FAD-dependent oxidoreductase [Cytophaga sp.]|uniref:FAD-dependent oxidoreductase n=1 Tax=Cytophaga sp. TaxID=29535 RepID=UPI003F8132A9
MNKQVTICGAGLVGSLLAIFLKRQNMDVRVFEKRPDPRKSEVHAGRSINLAISQRGLRALGEAAPGLEKQALALAVPMYGREIHDLNGELHFQAYGETSQHINSIGRAALNELLISTAEQLGVPFSFDLSCSDYDAANQQWIFTSASHEIIKTLPQEILIGADGAFSTVRAMLSKKSAAQPVVDTLDYAYKELEIYSKEATRLTNKEALHIWPRERFMLIALPNADGSYTATLFLPLQGEISFEKLNSPEAIHDFFNTYFADACKLIPNLTEQFSIHPTSKLFTVHTNEWFNTHTLLIGDAAHALVPFYGQGMNAGFEDCRILAEIISTSKEIHWKNIFAEFYRQRKVNADAISDLALKNFIEMRDHVADAEFLVRKQIEKYLHQVIPDIFVPQYTLVSFTDTPYAEAMQAGIEQDAMFEEIMQIENIAASWPTEALQEQVLATVRQYAIK